MGAVVTPSIERRFIDSKGCYGLQCKSGDAIPEGEVLAVVPFHCCPSPYVALASPWGKALNAAVGNYTLEDGVVKVDYPRESALTMVFTALAMHPRSPICDYINHITVEQESDALMQKKLGDTLLRQKQCIDQLHCNMLDRIHCELSDRGIEIEKENLYRAHAICESRCVQVPLSEEVFGGPALVPVVDLVNHSRSSANLSVYVTPGTSVPQLLRQHSRLSTAGDMLRDHPFCVVMRASQDIGGGAELTYQYIDPEEDPELYANQLYWASRFHFVPSQ